jgi:hypothetical protein
VIHFRAEVGAGRVVKGEAQRSAERTLQAACRVSCRDRDSLEEVVDCLSNANTAVEHSRGSSWSATGTSSVGATAFPPCSSTSVGCSSRGKFPLTVVEAPVHGWKAKVPIGEAKVVYNRLDGWVVAGVLPLLLVECPRLGRR